MIEDLQFYDPLTATGTRRAELLLGAANAADNLRNFAGTADSTSPDAGAQALRELMKDEIILSERPEVYPIKVEDALKSVVLPVPVAGGAFGSKYKFFLVKFPFDLHPAGPWNFNQLKLQINFRAGDQERCPKVLALFPEKRWQDVLKADARLQIDVSPNLEFGVNTGDLKFKAGQVDASAKAEVGAKAKASLGLTVGPLQLDWKKALVKTCQPGLEWAWWEIGGADLRRGDSPPFMVVLQVPEANQHVSAVGRLQATRYYDLIRGVFRNITPWPRVYREFIEAGVPCSPEPVTWDLTQDVTRAE